MLLFFLPVFLLVICFILVRQERKTRVCEREKGIEREIYGVVRKRQTGKDTDRNTTGYRLNIV